MIQPDMHWIGVFGTALLAAGSCLAGGYKLIDMMIDKKLVTLQINIVRDINGSYIRKGECKAFREKEDHDFTFIMSTLNKLQEGQERINQRLLDMRME